MFQVNDASPGILPYRGSACHSPPKCSRIAAITAPSVVTGTLSATEEGRPLVMTLSWWTNTTDSLEVCYILLYVISVHGLVNITIENCVLRHRHFRSHTGIRVLHYQLFSRWKIRCTLPVQRASSCIVILPVACTNKTLCTSKLLLYSQCVRIRSIWSCNAEE